MTARRVRPAVWGVSAPAGSDPVPAEASGGHEPGAAAPGFTGEVPLLRVPPRPGPRLEPEDSQALGKAARNRVPRERQAEWQPAVTRKDPVLLLQEQAGTWSPELAAIRFGRMAASPFAFYRGAAAIMAADLNETPGSGLGAQLCGDAHVGNFGGFLSPDRDLFFDINDFDETLPGPWEWDVKRLAASLQVVAQGCSCDAKECRALVLPAVSAYRRAMQEFAALPNLDVWYAQLGMAGIKRRWGQELRIPEVKAPEKEFAAGRLRDNARPLEKLAVRVDHALRIASHPPLVTPVEELLRETAQQELEERVRLGLRQARDTMPAHARSLLDRYKYLHMARKVVGVGGVGPSTWIVLLAGRDEQDLLFLQVKEAGESVLEPYLGKSRYANPAERVVEGQRMLQKAGDIFLGWGDGAGNRALRDHGPGARALYVRQLWDWKTPADVEAMSMRQLLVFGQACGWILARAHARSGDRVAIASYLGKGPVFDEAIAHFAAAYADQNQRDHHALCAAIASGRITARPAGD